MSDQASGLQKALMSALTGDAVVGALLGTPPRIWDRAPPGAACPHLTFGAWASRPLNGGEGATEHRLSLTCVSRFAGMEEARAVCAAVRAALETVSDGDGIRVANLAVTDIETGRSTDGRRILGTVRLRAVTENGEP